MLTKQYNVAAHLDLDTALRAASPEPTLPTRAERTVVATGGGCQPRGWNLDLNRPGRSIAMVALRTAPDEPTPSSLGWAHVARTLTSSNGWQGRDWAAVRTSATSMVLVVATDEPTDPAHPPAGADLTRRWQTSTGRNPPWTLNPEVGQPPIGAPLRIVDARFDHWQRLTILVPHIPTLAELRFTPHQLPHDPHPRARHPGTDILYVATHPGGNLCFLLGAGDGLGSNGKPFDLHLHDGTATVVVGPWFGSTDEVARRAPASDLYPGDVIFHDKADGFLAGNGGWGGNLTRAAAQHALRLAARHHGHTAAPARAFQPLALGPSTVASAAPLATGHPTHPPPSAAPPRRAR